MKKDWKNFLLIGLLLIGMFLAGVFFQKKQQERKEGEVAKEEKLTPSANQVVSFTPQKTAKPQVKFFVMSFCPYANQAEAGLERVYRLLKDKVDWQPRYIIGDKKTSCEQSCPYRVWSDEAKRRCEAAVNQGQIESLEECRKYFPYSSTKECIQKACLPIKKGEWESLHGEGELHQDIREICAYQEGDWDKWWRFVILVNNKCNFKNVDTCWEDQAKEAGLDIEKIRTCEKNKINNLAKAELAEREKYKVDASPTVFINEVLYNGGFSPESYKKAICDSFENPPEECSQVLGEESAPVVGGCQ